MEGSKGRHQMMRLTSFAKIFAQVLLESITRLSSHMSQHHNPSQLICVDTSITASETEAPLLTAVGRVLADCVRRTGPGTCRHPVLQQPPPPLRHYYLVTYLLPIAPPHFLLSRPASLLQLQAMLRFCFLSNRPPLEATRLSAEEYNGL